jgi:hypothetical protein
MSEELEKGVSELKIKEAGLLSLPEKPLQWITEYCDLETVFRLRLVCKRFDKVVRDGKRLRTSLWVVCAGILKIVFFRVEYCLPKKISDVEDWLQETSPEQDFWLSRLTSVLLGGIDFGMTTDAVPMMDMALLAHETHEFRMDFPSTVLEVLERVGAKSTEFRISWPTPVTHPKTHELLEKLDKSDCVEKVRLCLKTKEGKGLTVRDGFGKVKRPLKIGPKVTEMEFMFLRPGDNPFGWVKLCEDPKIRRIQFRECFPQYTLRLEDVEKFAAKCPELACLRLDEVSVSFDKDEFLNADSTLHVLVLKKCKPKFGNRVVSCPSITAPIFIDCSNMTVSDHLAFPNVKKLILGDNHGGSANVKPYLNQIQWFSIIAYKWSSLNILTIPELATSSVTESRVDIHTTNCTPLDINTKTIGNLKKIPNLKELALMVTNKNTAPIPTVTDGEKNAIKQYLHSWISTHESFEYFKFCYGVDVEKDEECQDNFLWNAQDIYSIRNNV